MAKPKNDVLQGTLDLLILKTLEKEPMHGYGIASRIERISDELLRVEEGSLYPALHRIEQTGWIRAEWKLSENGRQAKFYRLTLGPCASSFQGILHELVVYLDVCAHFVYLIKVWYTSYHEPPATET